MARNVLVTGVSRYLGSAFARAISDVDGIERVIGVDLVPPRYDIGKASFARVDIRHPLISRVMEDAQIDTVVHLNVVATSTAAGGRAPMKEINVIGSMQLLAACQKSTTVSRLVVKSTAGVYGSSANDPAMFTEDTSALVPPKAGWCKDSAEVEGYVRAFSRRRPDVAVATLRFANIVGPGMRTALTDYFELPVVPVVAGYDPRVQLVHEDDAVAATVLATTGDLTGAVNVAGDGVLSLLQMLAMAGRVPVMVPQRLTGLASRIVRTTTGVDIGPDEFRFFKFGRGLDTTRMRTRLGLEPTYTTRAAFEDLIATRRIDGWHGVDLKRALESVGLVAS